MDIDIIGGGINGLTVGVLLASHGHSPTIYTKQTPSDYSWQNAPPEFPSLYASASVIPHSYNVPGRLTVLQTSLQCFRGLAEHRTGVRIQRHYELDEQSRDKAWYLKLMDNVDVGTARELSEPPLVRSDAPDVAGYAYDVPFVQMPEYLNWLENRFYEEGGSVQRTVLTDEDLTQLPAECVVNTAGAGSRILFDDDDVYYLRGHLVYAEAGQFEEPFSYNYRPSVEAFKKASDEPGSVYAYPRNDLLILGGTTQYGKRKDGAWMGYEDETWRSVGGVDVPEPIVTLNQQLLAPFGIEIEDALVGAGYGLRPCRDGGVRLEQEEYKGRRVVHNYGHGGAGVTYSWGCAHRVFDLLGLEPSPTVEQKNDPLFRPIRC